MTAPQGTPALNPETHLSNNSGFLAADVSVPASGGWFGSYAVAETAGACTTPTTSCFWYGWQVAIPGQ